MRRSVPASLNTTGAIIAQSSKSPVFRYEVFHPLAMLLLILIAPFRSVQLVFDIIQCPKQSQ